MMTDPSPIRVLVADDHPTVLAGLAAIIGLQRDMAVVAEAANGRAAIALWQMHRPDVALLDLRMPEIDGVGVIEAIRAVDRTAKIVILTTFDTDNDVHRAIKAGARGYLLKDAPREDLLGCVREVHAGATCIPPAVAVRLAAAIGSDELTAREHEVLQLLAEGRSNRDIGVALGIGETTVKSHVRAVFSKLDVLTRTEAVRMATRRGLLRD
jgi:DNA-binding NarL/FixJ family response regulator